MRCIVCLFALAVASTSAHTQPPQQPEIRDVLLGGWNHVGAK